MVVLLHGTVGGWDEFAIAIAAFVVLWVAVKLAGRKPASEDDADDELAAHADSHPPTDPTQSPAPTSRSLPG